MKRDEMNDEGLRERLRAVDQSLGTHVRAIDVDQCVTLAHKRHRRRQASRSVVLGLLVLVVGIQVYRQLPGPPQIVQSEGDSVAQPATADDLKTQLVETRRKADSIANSLLQRETRQQLNDYRTRLAELEANPALPPEMLWQEATDFRAAVTLDFAHQLAREIDEPQLAAVEYQQLVQDFPGSKWAEEAEASLAQLQ